jgi:hypothetical protein
LPGFGWVLNKNMRLGGRSIMAYALLYRLKKKIRRAGKGSSEETVRLERLQSMPAILLLYMTIIGMLSTYYWFAGLLG